MERIKFFSVNDMACGYYLKKMERLFEQYDEGKEVQDINDIIELYNTKKYLDNKLYLKDWTPDDIESYEIKIKSYFELVAKFICHITNDNFETFYSEVDRHYRDDFWELIEKFKIYERITQDQFRELINTSEVSLHELLTHKIITEYFGVVIRDYMLSNPSSAELLLNKYEMKHNYDRDSLYFPRELSSTDKENIIINYIDGSDPNLNYLRLIVNIQSNKDKLEISPKTLLKASKKAKDQESQWFKGNSGMLMKTSVAFSKSQEEEIITKIEEQSISITYSVKWIEDNMDYPTLLNNFIYLFEFVDLQIRCTLVNKFNRMGVFERFLVTSSKNAYIKGIEFEQKNALSFLQMAGYYNQLFSFGVRLEEIVEWFFEEYLPAEFNAHNFRVTMPSSSSTFLEKCTNIMPAMESVLKQFSLFVQEGEIDFELLEIRSEHLIYKNIPSLLDKKYVYGVGEEFNTITFLLYSDQNGLGYIEKLEESFDNFYELLCNEKIKIEDYPDYQKSQINWLVNHKYLEIDEGGYLIFSNKLLVNILKDLYFNEVISYWKYPEPGRNLIDKLEKNNVVRFESSLFSKPEQDYINYLLNKSQFNNGLDLRNKYSHTQPNTGVDEKKHEQNYIMFLRLFIISLIKINDDFCTSIEVNSSNKDCVI